MPVVPTYPSPDPFTSWFPTFELSPFVKRTLSDPGTVNSLLESFDPSDPLWSFLEDLGSVGGTERVSLRSP